MHSEPEHFSSESARLMQMTAEQIALILDNAQLYNERQQVDKTSHSIEEQLSTGEEFSLIGIYIIFGEGNFLYANPRFAEIFGYRFSELVSLDSVLDLVAPESRDFFTEQMNQCLYGHSKYLTCKFKGLRKDRNLINVEIYGTRTKLYGKFVVIGAVK